MQLHNFKEDFAKYHPGALGKIIARVKDIKTHFKTYGFPDTIKKVILKSQKTSRCYSSYRTR
jgi:hypothetical protein